MPAPASSSYTPPTPGTVLASRYRVEETLGSGGMADVFRAVELGSGRSVAVKILRTSPDQSPEATARLRREGQVLRSLKHPAIVGIEEVTELEGGRVMLVMEMLRGETLGARMRRGRLDPIELAPILAGTAAGLAAAHANGVVHRDLKPDNIFLCAGNDGRVQVKLLDFGVSKVFGGERLTQTGQVLGTPRYMSPEQLGAEPEVDHRVDIYSLGVILYEALAGKPPFLAPTPTDLIVAILNGKIAPLKSLRPDLPPAIEAVVMRAMARVRDARFRAATEMAEAFFEAAGIAPGAVARPRAGMATTPLGSLKTLDPALAALAPAPVAPVRPPVALVDNRESLTPGTFSELPAFDEAELRRAAEAPIHNTAPSGAVSDPGPPAVAMAATALAPLPLAALPIAAPVVAPAAATAPASDVVPRAREIPRTAISMMEPVPPAVLEARSAVPYVPPATTNPLAPVPRAPAPVALPPAEILEPTPRRGGRFVLAFLGLAAGALTAGIAVVVLGFMGVTSTGTTHAPPPPPSGLALAADAGASTSADAAATATGEPTPPPATTATGVDPTPPPTTTTASHHGAHHTGHGGTTPPPPTTGTTTAHTTPPPDPHTDPLGAAQRALSDGSAAECVEILSGLITGGGTPIALRRRADCLMRLGRREEAIADYQRFCRIAPDHPAIAEVRETLEGMGRTCP